MSDTLYFQIKFLNGSRKHSSENFHTLDKTYSEIVSDVLKKSEISLQTYQKWGVCTKRSF